MRPVTLRFVGLRSYLATAEIDFTDLDCFAVIGDTGAGKSTILEALSIALYGRQTWTSPQDVLIADGAKQLQVELCFEMDGTRWTVTRSWKRSGANENKLTGPTPADNVDGATQVTERITELLGLDFAQFTRAVVLPQGKFDALLMQRPAERNKTLKSLLGVGELAAVGDAARRARQRWHDHIEHANGARGGLPLDPDAGVNAAIAALGSIRARVADLEVAVAAAAAADHDRQEATIVLQRLEPALARIPTVDAEATAAALADAARVVSAVRLEHDELRARRAEHVAAAEAQREAATACLDGFERPDDAIAAAQRLRQAIVDLPTLRTAVDTAKAAVDAAGDEQPDFDHRPLVEAVREARATVDATADAAAQAATVQRDAQGGVERWQAAQTSATLAASKRREADQRSTQAAAALVECQQEVAGLRREFDDAVVEVQRIQSLHAVAAVAADHGPGDACPVCEQVLPTTFSTPAAPVLDAALASRDAIQARQRSAEASLESRRSDEAAARAGAASAADAESAAIEAADAAAAALVPLGVDPTADDALAALRQAAADADAAHAAAQAGAERAGDDLAAAERAADAARNRWEVERADASRRLESAEAALRAMHGAITGIVKPWAPTSTDDHDLAAAADRLEAAIAARSDRLDVAHAEETAAAAVAQQLDEVRTRRDDLVMTPLNAVVRDVSVWREAVDRLDGPPLPAIPGVEGTDSVSDVVDVLTTVLRVGQSAVEDATRSVAATRRQAGDAEARVHDALAPVGLATLADARDALAAGRAAVEHAERDLAAARTQAEHAAAIDAFLGEAIPYRAVLDVIARSMRDGQFVDHVIGARERELLAEASRRLKQISNDRHGFVDDFGVVSLQSGETRPPEALSGGERFQASLALALVLVEIAARGAGQLEAIFVDEGFGSLDTESLHSALDTLVTIAGTGRQVGLISHLRAVAEGVDTVFHVAKDPTTGSVITRLDPDDRDRLLADDGAGLL